MRYLVRANLISFFLLGIVSILPLEMTSVGRILRSIVELAVIVILPGLNLTALLQLFLKKRLSLPETLTISALASILVIPLAITIEYSFLGILFPRLPLINSLSIFLLTGGLFFVSTFSARKKNIRLPLELPLTARSITQFFLSREFLLPFVLYAAIIYGIVAAFYPLPDSDPYYWASKCADLFAKGTVTPLSGDRPLFSALTYIFTVAMHTDYYAFFKYVLPAFPLFLLFPTSLLAKKFSHPLQKVIVFLLPFASGITIIYLTLPIPQELAGIVFFFVFTLLSYSWLSKEPLFFWLAGISIFLGYFYHEVLALPLLSWMLVAAIGFRKELLRKARENTLASILLIIFLIPYLSGPASFLLYRIQVSLLPALANMHPNLLFPEYYVNVDGNQMGWGDLLGVTKYYLFYIGPAIFAIFLAFFFSEDRKAKRTALLSKEGLVISFSFLLFFAIAEILPRLTGLAFLPDRAWVFAAPLALFLIFILFRLPIGHNRLFLWILIIAFSLNIGGALYINTLKKYVVTDGQLASAEWIRQNLPKNRVIFSFENQKSLSFFSDSRVIDIQNPNFYFDLRIFEGQFLSKEQQKQRLASLYMDKLEETKRLLSKTVKEDIGKENMEMDFAAIQASLESTRMILTELRTADESQDEHFYVYHVAPNPRNPYIDRPYLAKLPGKEDRIIFNQVPDRFKKVYSNETEHISSWEIL